MNIQCIPRVRTKNGIFLVGETLCQSLLCDHIWGQVFGEQQSRNINEFFKYDKSIIDKMITGLHFNVIETYSVGLF